jgi:hypothetical protein
MAITINGSGTVTGISAGGLPDGVITTDDIAANAVTTAKLGSGEASGLCKAWVNFNGTGTVAIRASYNVSSITDNGTGDYTVNFTTALPNANYCVTQGSEITHSGGRYYGFGLYGFSNNTVNSFRIRLMQSDGAGWDGEQIHAAVFR